MQGVFDCFEDNITLFEDAYDIEQFLAVGRGLSVELDADMFGFDFQSDLLVCSLGGKQVVGGDQKDMGGDL